MSIRTYMCLAYVCTSCVLLWFICVLILVEIIDYGYPQKTDSGILKTYITQQGVKTQVCVCLCVCVCVYMLVCVCVCVCVY